MAEHSFSISFNNQIFTLLCNPMVWFVWSKPYPSAEEWHGCHSKKQTLFFCCSVLRFLALRWSCSDPMQFWGFPLSPLDSENWFDIRFDWLAISPWLDWLLISPWLDCTRCYQEKSDIYYNGTFVRGRTKALWDEMWKNVHISNIFLIFRNWDRFSHTSVCDLWLLWQDAQIKFLMILCCSTISIDLHLQVKMTTVWKRKEARGKKKHQP